MKEPWFTVIFAVIVRLTVPSPLWSQDVRNMRPTDVDPRKDCVSLDAKKTAIPNGDIGKLVRQAVKLCDEYQSRRLSEREWGERVLTLEEAAAFSQPPAEFSGIIPFRNATFWGYETYSLFLFPSSEWKNRKDEVKRLYDAFASFGDAIGDKRLAIWFSGKDDTVDVRRSKLYCDRFGLDYNSGPFVVTLQKSPATWKTEDSAVIIDLGGLLPERRVRVLNVLEQDLRLARQLSQRSLLFVEIRERLLSAAERNQELLRGIVMKKLGL